jgi:hypothetical protein
MQSARELMEFMGKKNFEREYLGSPTKEVIKQQLFSLVNEFSPDTMTEKEIQLWIYKLVEIYEQMKANNITEQLKDVEIILTDKILLQLKIPLIKSALVNILLFN